MTVINLMPFASLQNTLWLGMSATQMFERAPHIGLRDTGSHIGGSLAVCYIYRQMPFVVS